MENENFDIVQAVKQLVEDYGHLANEIAEVKAAIYDNLLNPIEAEFKQMQHDDALSDFRCKYAEKLEPFGDKLKAIEGDDFDIVEKAFDDFSTRTDGMDEEEYVGKLVDKVNDQLNVIASAFGVKPEEVEEVKIETPEGEVKAEVEDGEVVAVEQEGETEVEAKEEPATEEAPAETPAEEALPEIKDEEEPEVEERPAEATDTPDDDAENAKYWQDTYDEYTRWFNKQAR